MNLNDELAAYGEPPLVPREQAEADFLARLLERLERGGLLAPDASEPEFPSLASSLSDTFHSGAVFRRDAGLLDDNRLRGSQLQSTEQLPDPFPGEFQILDVLGQGAFGKVWLARDLNLSREVALKTLRPPHPTLSPNLGGEGRVRGGDSRALASRLAALQREAGILAQFSHPNIVQVYAWRQSGDKHYLVLQYVAGGSLDRRLRHHGPLPWPLAARYIADVGHGLVEVHRRGIVHRDIKPANILFCNDGDRDEALLTDFGVSAYLSEPGSSAGTPLYMSPEAFAGQLSPRLDVYSLSATLFHLVTGEPPFLASTSDEVRQKSLQGLPALDPRCQATPEALEQVIRAGLMPDPARRPDLKEFVDTLRSVLNQLLADSLTLEPTVSLTPRRVNLQLNISRQVGPNRYQPVTATPVLLRGVTRNLKKVPRPPEQVHLRTGELVRVEVVADQAGYVTVFNIGPSGDLNILYPEEGTTAPPQALQPSVPLHIVEVELQPPTGRERVFAVWTRQPVALGLKELRGVVDKGSVPIPSQYHATRNMVKVKQSVQQLAPADWHAVVLELEHVG